MQCAQGPPPELPPLPGEPLGMCRRGGSQRGFGSVFTGEARSDRTALFLKARGVEKGPGHCSAASLLPVSTAQKMGMVGLRVSVAVKRRHGHTTL